jgi:hypothetical protein
LTAYGDSRGYVVIDQFTLADADRFYAGLKLGPRTKGTRLGVLRVLPLRRQPEVDARNAGQLRHQTSGRLQ